MNIRFDHCNINVIDLERSIKFYKEALGLEPVGEIHRPTYDIVYLGYADQQFRLELTHLHDHPQPYELGENESHIAFRAGEGEYDKLHDLHSRMGCICFENPEVGIYFIEDPDGYWLEIIPTRMK